MEYIVLIIVIALGVALAPFILPAVGVILASCAIFYLIAWFIRSPKMRRAVLIAGILFLIFAGLVEYFG